MNYANSILDLCLDVLIYIRYSGVDKISTEIECGGPRTRHLDSFLHVPLFLWGGNHAASRKTAGVYIHMAFKWEQGQDNSISWYLLTEFTRSILSYQVQISNFAKPVSN